MSNKQTFKQILNSIKIVNLVDGRASSRSAYCLCINGKKIACVRVKYAKVIQSKYMVSLKGFEQVNLCALSRKH